MRAIFKTHRNTSQFFGKSPEVIVKSEPFGHSSVIRRVMWVQGTLFTAKIKYNAINVLVADIFKLTIYERV